MQRERKQPRQSYYQIVIIALVGAMLMSGCALARGQRTPVTAVPGGDPQLGQEAILRYGCTSCHVIPGIAGPDSHVAPPLDNFAHRTFVGSAPNTADNLILWIQSPQSINRQAAMPPLGVSEQDARHIAAYLYTLDAGWR
jgi:cytochrome c